MARFETLWIEKIKNKGGAGTLLESSVRAKKYSQKKPSPFKHDKSKSMEANDELILGQTVQFPTQTISHRSPIWNEHEQRTRKGKQILSAGVAFTLGK